MTARISPRRLATSRGDILVEMGLCLFLLMIVLLAVFELSRMVLVYTTIANAGRAGVRYAIVHGGTRTAGTPAPDGPSGPGNNPTEVVKVVKNFASAGLLDISKLTPTCAASGARVCVHYPNGNAVGGVVNVTVVYPYDPFVGYFTMLGINLGSTTQGIIAF